MNPKRKAPTQEPLAEAGQFSRSEQALRFIREAIQQGRLKPGDRLREAELAKMIGISRTPLRDALSRLKADGLIAHDPTRGMVVAELDYNTVSELYAVREVLEGAAARMAARHASDVEISMLEELAVQYRKSLDDPATMVIKNRQFHETLCRCAHNRYLRKILISLHDAVALLGKTSLIDRERAEESIVEHDAIVEAIRNRDPVAAERAANDHMRAAQKRRVRQFFSADN